MKRHETFMSEVSFLERIRLAWAAFRLTGGIELPDLGRSSEEDLGTGMSDWNDHVSLSPVVDFEMLETLRNFWIFNPDFSQYVENIQNLGNTGHDVTVDASSDSAAEAALGRINEAASRIYKNGAGVDGLFNAYFAQIAWSGALSSEDVVNLAAKRVEQTVIVPILKIRFRWDKELQEYLPYQKASNFGRSNGGILGLIPLHPETYKYYVLQTVENSPYAKPPASAAIDPITNSQKPIIDNIRHIAKKFGLMGLVTALVAPPPKKPNETDGEHETRKADYLKTVAKTLENIIPRGLMVGYRDMKFEHTDLTGSAQGVYDMNRMSEEQVFSGLGSHPVFHGRTDSSTETYADVVYSLLSAKSQNIQRLVKRRQEQTYRLDLRLGGIEVEGISISFKKTFSRNRIQEAQATETELRIAISKARAGIISVDEAAQELGYESAYDSDILLQNITLAKELRGFARRADAPRLRSFAFRFDKQSQRYKPALPKINPVMQRPGAFKAENFDGKNIVPFEKKTAQIIKA